MVNLTDAAGPSVRAVNVIGAFEVTISGSGPPLCVNELIRGPALLLGLVMSVA
jgi:hypothetical protein